jgi:hypothetical protein
MFSSKICTIKKCLLIRFVVLVDINCKREDMERIPINLKEGGGRRATIKKVYDQDK